MRQNKFKIKKISQILKCIYFEYKMEQKPWARTCNTVLKYYIKNVNIILYVNF